MSKKKRHSKTRLRYHLILVTKYRRKCLNGIKELIFESFRFAESKMDLKIHNMNTDDNHIHLLISFPPSYSITQTVRGLKQFTTRYVYSHNESYMRRFYWRRKRVLWHDGYYCSTVGLNNENVINKYIDNQGC